MQPHLLSHEAYVRIVYALEFTDREDQLQTPEEVHVYAACYNWDDGDAAMRRLIDHPAIDAGTVRLIYWRASPQFFCQYTARDEVPDWVRSDYDLVKEIEQRFREGFYGHSSFHFDPRNYGGMDLTQETTVVDIKQPIPDHMFQATPGARIDWDDPYDHLTEADWDQLNAEIEADDAREAQ